MGIYNEPPLTDSGGWVGRLESGPNSFISGWIFTNRNKQPHNNCVWKTNKTPNPISQPRYKYKEILNILQRNTKTRMWNKYYIFILPKHLIHWINKWLYQSVLNTVMRQNAENV